MRGVVLGIVLLAAPAWTESVRPDRGIFLVAKPKIDGGPFYHSVVLLLSHGDEGTLGLIVNRATDVPLTEALPELADEDEEAHALHFGGPVGLNGLLFLFRADEPPDNVAHVMDDVYFGGDPAVLEKLLKKEQARSELKLYLGHAGWAPGQLQGELSRGDWDLVKADPFTVFQKDPQTMWRELSGKGVTLAAHSCCR